jgi:predicted amidohydrolase
VTVSSPITMAAAQAPARPGDIVANSRTAVGFIREAAEMGASLVVFPELFLSGYDLERMRLAPERCDVRGDDCRLEPLQAACRKNRIQAVIGASVLDPGGRRLAAFVIDADGVIRDRYAKRHLWGPERDLFVPGDAPRTVDLNGWRIAIGICVEATLPEHPRAAAEAGAMVYLAPSADTSRIIHAARARENGMYIVYANYPGPVFSGLSAIYDPTGECVAELDGETHGLILAEAKMLR